MNLCFLIGKIISKIQYKFIINSKDTAIAIFKLKLQNESIVTIKAYNEMEDYYYSHFDKDNVICIKGRLNTKRPRRKLQHKNGNKYQKIL